MQFEDQNMPLEEVLPLLKKISFFEGLPEEDLELIADIVQTASADAGDILFEEDDPGDAFYIVVEGSVELSVTRPSGRVEKLAIQRRGGSFGEMSFLNDAPRSATATVLEPTRLLAIDRERFWDLLSNNRLALRVLTALSNALRALDLRFAAQERLAAGKERGNGEADLAAMSRVLQRGLMPAEAPRVSGFDIAAGTNVADDGPGRTLWDHFLLGDGKQGLLVLNVQGEGLPPGHYLALTRSLLRELARDHDDLQALLARVNSGLTTATVEGMEQHVEAGILLPSGREVVWAGAGRCPGAVIRRSGVFEEFSSHGPPLGMLEGFQYGTQAMELGAGDAVIVLSEASQGIFRGTADLVATLQGKPVGEIVSTVHKALKKAAEGDAPPETSVLFLRKQ